MIRPIFSHSGEDRHFSAGSDLRIFNMHGVPVGVLTCYELKYAELARSLAVHGAGVIVLRARNQPLYSGIPNETGDHDAALKVRLKGHRRVSQITTRFQV